MMRKTLAVLLAVMMLAACGLAAAEQEARKIETPADAEEWIGIFLGEHPEELEGSWAISAEMAAAVNQLGGFGAMAKQMAVLGTAEKIGPAYEGEISGYKAYYIPCVFSVMPADLILVVQDGALGGLTTGAYTGKQEEEADADTFDSVELALPVSGLGELPGILTLPKGEGPFPAVVLVHGSGPNDMDETISAQKPFRDLAEGLAAEGIAVYRYDKRTYVYKEQLMGDLRFTLEGETIEDAVNAVQLLAAQEKIDPSRIYVLGHSLGGNAVPAIAAALKEQPANGCGFIMMAASPRPLDVLMREQYEFLYSLVPEVTAEQQAQKDALLAELDKLQNLDSLGENDVISGAYVPYWKWLAAYDILQGAEEIDKPVLLLQGEEDYQVTMKDFGIWKDAVGEKDNWKLISYPGLTHLFSTGVKAEGPTAYSRPGNVDNRVISDIAGFINGK